jgi:hypothetical protein
MADPPVSTTISHSPRSLRDRTRREDSHLKFYELRDNLHDKPIHAVGGNRDSGVRERTLAWASVQECRLNANPSVAS